MIKFILPIFLIFVTSVLSAQHHIKKRFRLPTELKEVSGLHIAATDSLWWHNDSGDGPFIYLTDGKGELLSKQNLFPAQAKDWEDMTSDNTGQLYLGDFGDNSFSRNDVRIYRYQTNTGQLDSILFDYPDDKHYNVEAFFWYKDSLHLFTKSRIHRASLPTYHFAVSASAGNHTAVLRDSFFIQKRVVTAAAIDEASGRMVLLTYYYKFHLGFIPYSVATIYCFSDYPEGQFLQGKVRSKRISCLLAKQYESIDFISPDRLLVASEQTLFLKPKAKQVRWKN